MDNLEQEIAELQKKIEEKRNLLEQQGGIIEEKELVKEAVREVASSVAEARPEDVSPVATPAPAEKTTAGESSYLDLLDDESVSVLNDLIARLPEIGLAKTVAKAEALNIPYLVDALHDALVDRLYDELKSRGFVK